MEPSPRHPLARLIHYARPYRRRIALATLYSFLNKVFDLAPPALIGAAVDVVVKREDSLLASLGFPDVQHQLWILGGLTVLIWGLESAFEYLYAWVWRNLAQTIQHDLRLDAYAHLQQMEQGFFEDRSTGGLMAILNDDVNQLERFLDGGANSLIQVATTVVVVGASFFALSPAVAILAFLPMPVVVVGSFRFQSRIAPRYAEVRERVALLNGQLSNNLSGVATIKSFTAEDREIERIRGLSEAYRTSNRRAIRLSAAFTPLIRMAIVVSFTATLLYGGQLALDGAMEVGTYSVLIFLTQRLLWPLTRLGETFDLYQRAMASTDRALDLLDAESQVQSGEQTLSAPRGAIRFDDVTFAYAGREPVLQGFSYEIPAGRTVGVVGSTGAGKSTLVRLLLRLYDVGGGSISFDGVDVRALQLRDLRSQVGLVAQSTFLFSGTIRENIAYGRPDASDDAIRAAAQAAEAHDFISGLPDGYDTRVGERGQKLSGGQRQRLALARAVLTDPPVLVLDEATSAVDNETEAAIQRSMAQISADRTTIIIAHRLSTVRRADEILVLDRGRIAERGTHEALLARGGTYARLWRVQTGAALDAPAHGAGQ